MENKKKDELQNRREFFKKAAKGALPILGAIVLANVPSVLKAAETEPMGCPKVCRDSCAFKCEGCLNNCARSCTSCSDGCARGCHANCYTGCNGRVNAWR